VRELQPFVIRFRRRARRGVKEALAELAEGSIVRLGLRISVERTDVCYLRERQCSPCFAAQVPSTRRSSWSREARPGKGFVEDDELVMEVSEDGVVSIPQTMWNC
jgi:hypothetical protein